MSAILRDSLKATILSGLSRYKFQILLVSSLLMILLYPYMDDTRAGELLLDILVSAVLLAALMSIASNRKTFLIAIVIIVPAIIGSWWPISPIHPIPHLMGVAFSSLFFIYVTIAVFLEVFRRQRVDRDTLFGAVCVYILLGLVWCNIYVLLESIFPGSFSLGDTRTMVYGELTSRFLYYSYTTLTTTGYGDITPVTDQAQSLAILEQGIGVLYVAMMVARLVGMYRPDDRGQVE